MGVFSFSDEDTAKSFPLANKIDAETIRRRRSQLMAIQKKISARNLKHRVGQRLQVMLEGPSKDTDLVWEARLEGMAPEIDGKVYITEFEGVNDAQELPAPGTLATIEVIGTKEYDLIGRVIEFEARPNAAQIPLPNNDLFPILSSR
jgi:ribosomal protein S12 methylthiotransferase